MKRTAWKAGLAFILAAVLAVGLAPGIFAEEGTGPSDPPEDSLIDPVDSGPVDSGPVDSGPVDSGPVDSRPVDSRPVDSGPVDSGPVDSGPVDSRPVDSGPVDSGPVDSGPVDSELEDSESVTSDQNDQVPPATTTDTKPTGESQKSEGTFGVQQNNTPGNQGAVMPRASASLVGVQGTIVLDTSKLVLTGLKANEVITIPVKSESFATGTDSEPADDDDVKNDTTLRTKLSAEVTSDLAKFTDFFDVSVSVNSEATTAPPVSIVLKVRDWAPDTIGDTAFTISKLTLNFSGGTPATGSFSTTLTGKILAEDNQINGLETTTIFPTKSGGAVTLMSGGAASAAYDLLPGMFTYSGSVKDSAVTPAELGPISMSVTAQNGSALPVAPGKIDATLDKTTGKFTLSAAANTVPGTYNISVVLTAAAPAATGSREVYTFTVTVTSPARIKDIVSGAASATVRTNSTDDVITRSGKSTTIKEIDVESEEHLTIQFTPAFFTWDGAVPGTTYVSYEDMVNSGYEIRFTKASNENIIDSVTLSADADGNAIVDVLFDQVSGSNRKSISKTLYFYKNNVSVSGASIILNGYLNAKTLVLSDDEDYADISDGSAVISYDEPLRDVELYLGDSVTVVTDLTRNRMVWGVATEGPVSSADDRVMDKYWEIEYIYTIESGGLNRTGTQIYFDDWYDYGDRDRRRNVAVDPLVDITPTPLGQIADMLGMGDLRNSPITFASVGRTPRVQNLSSRYYDDRYYVYRPTSSGATTLVEIGTTDRGVEFATKYYLSATRLEGVSSASSGSSSSGGTSSLPTIGNSSIPPVGATPSGATPGGVYPANPNYNPINGQ